MVWLVPTAGASVALVPFIVFTTISKEWRKQLALKLLPDSRGIHKSEAFTQLRFYTAGLTIKKKGDNGKDTDYSTSLPRSQAGVTLALAGQWRCHGRNLSGVEGSDKQRNRRFMNTLK
ncbi:hypothetical protein DHD05_14870 [Arenibacter sp. N53]|nr:hypothetical protein [Arenibacter sp. N53]